MTNFKYQPLMTSSPKPSAAGLLVNRSILSTLYSLSPSALNLRRRLSSALLCTTALMMVPVVAYSAPLKAGASDSERLQQQLEAQIASAPASTSQGISSARDAASTTIAAAVTDQRQRYQVRLDQIRSTADIAQKKRLLLALSADLNGTPLPLSITRIKAANRAIASASMKTAAVVQGVKQSGLPPNARSAPGAADLAASSDAPQTPDIIALAASLNNNPVAILKWVQANIDFMPTAGSIQGAAGTLTSRRGNATDTANLLVALLRAAQIPARYATGTIEVPVASMLSWLRGPANVNAAIDLLNQGGLIATISLQAGQPSAIRLPHVWVEAWVSAYPARGAKNQAGDSWVPMDAAFKPYLLTPGKDPQTLAQLNGGNASALASRISAGVTSDPVLGRIDAINATGLQQEIISTANTLSAANAALQIPAITVADLYGSAAARPKLLPIVALTLPYTLISQDTLLPALADADRYQLSLNFYLSALDQLTNTSALTLNQSMPDLVGKTLALRYIPNSVADAAELARQLGATPTSLAGLPTRISGFNINMKAEVWLDAVKLGEFGPMKMGQPYFASVALDRAQDVAGTANRINISGRTGEVRVFGWDLVGNASASLAARTNQLNALASASSETEAVNAVASALDAWFASNDVYGQWSASVSSDILHRHATLGSAHTWLDVELNLGIAVATQLNGLAIGESPSHWLVAEQSGGDAKRLRWQLGQFHSSLSHVVAEQWTSGLGVSAVKVLATSLANQHPLWSISSANKSALTGLQLDPNLNQRLSDLIDAGQRVLVNATDSAANGVAPIAGSGWSGRGVIADVVATRATNTFIDGTPSVALPNTAARIALTGGAQSSAYGAGLSWLGWQVPGVASAIGSLWQTQHTPASNFTNSLVALASNPGTQRLTPQTVKVLSGLMIDRSAGSAVSPIVDETLWGSLLLSQLSPGIFSGSTPPTVTLTANQTAVTVGQGVNITLTATDLVGIASITLTQNGVAVPNPKNGIPMAFATPTAMAIDFVATAQDTAGNRATATLRVLVKDPASTTPPTVKIKTPVDGDEITSSTTVMGDVLDPALSDWHLLIAPVTDAVNAGSPPNWIELNRGTAVGSNIALGKFDPSIFDNGPYLIAVTATNANGLKSSDAVRVTLKGELKIGQFSLTFKDMNLDVGGLPLTVYRTYDTRRRSEKLDFGYGWSVNYQDISVKTSRTVGFDWVVRTVGTGLGQQICVNSLNAKTISIRLPGGKLDRWDVKTQPECQATLTYNGVTKIVFVPRDNTTSTLEATDVTDLQVNGNQLYDLANNEAADPKQFKMTLQDGTQYFLDRAVGITQIKDNYGNTISFTRNSITSSGGKSILMTRDTAGRIVSVTDATNVGMVYTYDSNGDLNTITDARNNKTTLSYQAGHLLTKFTDPNGNLLMRAEYDDQGRLTAQYDALGNKVALDHSQKDNGIELVNDRRGNTTEYSFNTDGNITQEKDALGGVTRYSYDALGYETAKTNPLGNTVRKTYNAFGNVTSDTDALGNTTALTLDPKGNPTQITDALGRVTQNVYDASGALKSITDPLGGKIQIGYTGQGELIAISDPTGKSIVNYTYTTGVTGADGGRLPSAQYDANNIATTFTYDANNRRIGESTVRTDLSNGSSTAVTVSTSRQFDANGNVTRETDALGHTTVTNYDALNRPINVTDASGRTITTVYDAAGRVTRITAPDGSYTQSRFDANGNSIAEIDALGYSTTNTYDALGRLTQTQTADGAITTNTYDAAGRLVQSSDALNHASAYVYDAVGRKTQQADQLGRITQYGYDNVGNLVTTTDAAGQVTTYTYDANNRRIKTTLPLVAGSSVPAVVKADYDAAGRKIKDTDANGQVTQYAYDNPGRLQQVTDANGNLTLYGFDEVGNRIRQQDANGHITRFRYDNGNRLIERRLPGGQAETFTYDAVGNKTGHTDFNGSSTAWTYDSLNRPVIETRKDGGGVTLSTLTSTYDVTGKVTTLTDSRGDTVHTYDTVGRLTNKQEPTGLEGSSMAPAIRHAYTYDANGNLTRHIVTIGTGVSASTRTTSYTWDAGNQLTSVTVPTAASDSINGVVGPVSLTTFEYDNLGRKSKQTAANGVISQWSYDAQSRITGVTHGKATGTAGATTITAHVSFAYQYNARGQRTQMVETFNNVAASPVATITRSTDYQYDNAGKLTSETLTTTSNGVNQSINLFAYQYDAVGNRVQKSRTVTPITTVNGVSTNGTPVPTAVTYSYDSNDRLISTSSNDLNDISATYAWNNDGSLATKAQGTQSWVYAWQKFGQEARLKRVTVRDSGNPNDPVLNKSVDFTLDGEGNRIARAVTQLDASGNVLVGTVSSPNPAITRFVIDNNRAYAEAVVELDVTNASGTSSTANQILRTTSFTPTGTGDIVQVTSAGQATFYAEHDALGSLKALTDSNGNLAAAQSTDAWGANAADFGSALRLTQQTTSLTTYGYAGEYFDDSVNMYYNRSRYLVPQVARFASMDSFAGNSFRPSSLNKYAYAEGNPISRIDPSGLFSMGELSSAMDASLTLANSAISTYNSIFGNPDDVKVDGIPSIWDYVMAMSIRGLASSFGGFSVGGNLIGQGGGKLIGHHVIPVYTCGHLDQKFSNLSRPLHDSLHTQLYNYTLAINVLGFTVDLIVYRKPTNRAIKTPMQRLGAKAVGRAAIAAGLGFFYSSEDLLGVGSPPIGLVLALETPRYIGKHNSAPDCQRQR